MRGEGGGEGDYEKAVTVLVLLMRSLNDFSIVIYISRKNDSVCFLYRSLETYMMNEFCADGISKITKIITERSKYFRYLNICFEI